MDTRNFCIKTVPMETVVVLVMMVLAVQARMVDISRDVQTVVRVHNDERMSPDLRAANMREMMWDSRLQSRAEQWASRCLYERPPHDFGVGANLYYQRYTVYGQSSARRLVKESLDSWIRQKDKYVYSSHCGAACLYVQMIHSDSDRVGCAMNTCQFLKARKNMEVKGTLFVCLYSPRVRLQDSFPYITGEPCSRCKREELCLGGYLCSKGSGTYAELRAKEPEQKRRPPPREKPQRDMSNDEMRAMLDIHNMLRGEDGLNPLAWDKYLERYCRYVINCSVDYPGPRHAYTNFHRLRFNSPTTNAVYDWMRDADVIPVKTAHKCRTPMDREECNHYTNMMQPVVTNMACATKTCDRGSRQLVCIYDSTASRRRSNNARRSRRTRRRWGGR